MMELEGGTAPGRGQMSVTRLRRTGALRACLLGMIVVIGPVANAPPAAGDDDHPRRHYYYRERALNRFWDDVERILGPRVGYEAQHGSYGPLVRLEVGAVDLTESDRRRVRDATPGRWAEVDLFRTRYSIRDLRELGFRAEEALRGAGLDRLWGGFAYLHKPDRVIITLVCDSDRARAVLRGELPDEAFRVEIGRFVAHGGETESRSEPCASAPSRSTAGSQDGALAWLAGLASVAVALGTTALAERRRRRERGATPTPAR
ncbi:MAG TPA: hypothetical protein VHN37_10185 [Actinomycetota bacterium]|nr:hypothetical protein [Actinomycetota bacterium]